MPTGQRLEKMLTKSEPQETNKQHHIIMKFSLFTTVILALLVQPTQAFFGGLFEFLFGPSTQTYTFLAVLSTAQETPVCAQTGGLGNAIATYDTQTKKFCYSLSYSGLSEPAEKFSHIHSPGKIGATGPVLFTLMTAANKAECFPAVGGLSAVEEESLLNNLWYFNVHTTTNCPSGELRGQIIKV